ncbi:MAG: tRNA lysidine(34) synthetase TilS [Ruminococcaceae bacterium]|nr:tRNA lysidine(34) synthetase TilS [Oscillospiraceae bacterium]
MAKEKSTHGFTSPSVILSGFLCGKEAHGIGAHGMPSSLLVAYSGGADSSCLLYLLKDWCDKTGVELFAAHVNHGIRGDEALRDRDHCVSVCKKEGIKLFVLDADVPRIAKETGKSIEGAARDVRYDFFARVMAENDIPVLCTAHNADDNLETLLFRLARGSAARGLCGIPPVRELEGGGFAVRPIISLTKDEILDICEEKSIEYVYDSTNADTAYTRNSIRATAMPVLREINPEAAEAALRFCENLRADCAYLDKIAENYLKKEGARHIGALASLEKPIFTRVITSLYAMHSGEMLESIHIEAVAALIREGREGASVSLPGRLKAEIASNELVFSADSRESKEREALAKKELLFGDNFIGGGYIIRLEYLNSTVSSQTTPDIQTGKENIYKLFTQAEILSDKIKGSLFARGRLAGDTIRTSGMTKDVRKLLSERKIPINKRDSYPIICDDEGILLIPGIAVRDGAIQKNKNCSERVCITLFEDETERH